MDDLGWVTDTLSAGIPLRIAYRCWAFFLDVWPFPISHFPLSFSQGTDPKVGGSHCDDQRWLWRTRGGMMHMRSLWVGICGGRAGEQENRR
eukprot:scaffold232652_cov37-Attheya_sp.AAC.1